MGTSRLDRLTSGIFLKNHQRAKNQIHVDVLITRPSGLYVLRTRGLVFVKDAVRTRETAIPLLKFIYWMVSESVSVSETASDICSV